MSLPRQERQLLARMSQLCAHTDVTVVCSWLLARHVRLVTVVCSCHSCVLLARPVRLARHQVLAGISLSVDGQLVLDSTSLPNTTDCARALACLRHYCAGDITAPERCHMCTGCARASRPTCAQQLPAACTLHAEGVRCGEPSA